MVYNKRLAERQESTAQNERWWVTIAACVLILSVATIWWTRLQVTESFYVSGLGATSTPTAPLFNLDPPMGLGC